MNVASYLEMKAQLERARLSRLRLLCSRCLQPERTCYCPHVQSFDPKMRFVILIHPLEVRKRIATGRMSHLVLENSQLIHGHNFTDNPDVNKILNDPSLQPVILYPGRASTNLSDLVENERADLFPPDKQLVVFVLDGTWSTAGKMLRHSANLRSIPQICFTPSKPSTFRVRKQPKKECYSTIEAIHQTLELLGPTRGFDPMHGEHGKLLHVFNKMVEQQLEFIRESRLTNRHSRHQRRKTSASE